MVGYKTLLFIGMMIIDLVIFIMLINFIGWANFRNFFIFFLITVVASAIIYMKAFKKFNIPDELVQRERKIIYPLIFTLLITFVCLIGAKYEPVICGSFYGFFINYALLGWFMPEMATLNFYYNELMGTMRWNR